MNTKICLTYTDASNYSKTIDMVVIGEITQPEIDAIRGNLEDSMFIIAEQVGLPCPREEMTERFGFDEDEDHVWTSMADWEESPELTPAQILTDEAPTHPAIEVGVLAQVIANAEWDVADAWERLIS